MTQHRNERREVETWHILEQVRVLTVTNLKGPLEVPLTDRTKLPLTQHWLERFWGYFRSELG